MAVPGRAAHQAAAYGAAADVPDFDRSDDEFRQSTSKKWRDCPTDVLPAWIAEMDVRPAGAVTRALHEAVDAGATGYPTETSSGVPEALSGWLDDQFGWRPDPHLIVLTADVVVGVMLAMEALCARQPVVVPVPCYPPFLDAVARTGRELIAAPCAWDDGRPVLDVEIIEKALAAGARTVLLTNPHNPLGRSWSASELRALREVVDRYGARVISDEIHAPLVLPGALHTPYATVDPDRHITVTSASKAWNLPGLKCAQIVASSAKDATVLRALPRAANRGLSSLGVAATVAAYRTGNGWLAALITHLDARRRQLGRLLSEMLPQVGWYPMEATYLAWVDARGTGLPDPAAAALREGRVLLDTGRAFGPGAGPTRFGYPVPPYDGFVRVNIGTSAERLERIVGRLATAWSGQKAAIRP